MSLGGKYVESAFSKYHGGLPSLGYVSLIPKASDPVVPGAEKLYLLRYSLRICLKVLFGVEWSLLALGAKAY